MRCNVGVNPFYLTDSHLIAEYRELPIVIGSLEKNDWKIKSKIPDKFKLGAGHINFFKNKLAYLKTRHDSVKLEMGKRGFKCTALVIDTDLYSDKYCNEWSPAIDDSMIVRKRIVSKLQNPKLVGFWRHNRKVLSKDQLENAMEKIIIGELFYV